MKNPLELCFPSKKTKDNFADADKAAASTSAPTTAAPASTEPTTHSQIIETPEAPKSEPTPAPQITTEIPEGGIATDSATPAPAGPKIAVVIYSMYGHIAKRAYGQLDLFEAANNRSACI